MSRIPSIKIILLHAVAKIIVLFVLTQAIQQLQFLQSLLQHFYLLLFLY